MVDWQEHIHSDPETLNGKPVIKDTRLSVDFILGLLAEGWSSEQILENYPALSNASLKAVFAYTAESMRDSLLYANE
ncbi:MAG: DUF433 domain-containing protein [Calditrichota bacterium]